MLQVAAVCLPASLPRKRKLILSLRVTDSRVAQPPASPPRDTATAEEEAGTATDATTTEVSPTAATGDDTDKAETSDAGTADAATAVEAKEDKDENVTTLQCAHDILPPANLPAFGAPYARSDSPPSRMVQCHVALLCCVVVWGVTHPPDGDVPALLLTLVLHWLFGTAQGSGAVGVCTHVAVPSLAHQ